MLLNQNKPAPIKNVRTNKTFLARFGTNNNTSFENVNKNNKTNSNPESPIIMKCLNELPKTKVVNNKKLNSEVSPPLIETKNCSPEVSQNAEEISIISHHSSTHSKDDEVHYDSNKNNSNSKRLFKHENNEQTPLEILTIYGDEQKDATNVDAEFKQVSSYFHEAQSNQAEILLQGNTYNNNTAMDDAINKENDNFETPNIDVKISRYVQDKSKIRSQFMQRFAVAPKRQVIPQVIINIDKDSINEPTLSKGNSNEHLQTISQTTAANNNDSLTASLAASLAVTVTQPFLKIQNDLENKMNGLIKQFEMYQKDGVDSKSESNELAKQKIEDDMKNLTEMKLKYIEKLQENQFQLMSQLIGTMSQQDNKIPQQQNTEQAQERLKSLLNEYKNELLNFKLKANNLEPRVDDSRSKSYTGNDQNRVKSKTKSKSPGKKGNSKNKSSKKNESVSRSVSPIKHFEPEYDCLQCAMNECGKHGRKTEFLEELLDNSSPYRKLHDTPNRNFIDENEINEKITTEPFKKSTIDVNYDELLFDKYLNQGRALDQMMQTNLKQTQSDEYKQQLAQENRHQAPKKSKFSDLEETLKEIEKSRESFEDNMKALLRNRESNYFHSISNANNKEEIEKMRVKKLIDGYLNVISKDVEKEVVQELIDNSKHLRLEAERDLDPRSRTRARIEAAKANNRVKQPQPKKETKMTADKYLKKFYGNELYEKIKKSELKGFEWSKEIDQNKQFDGIKKGDDIFDKIIAKPVNMPTRQIPRHIEPPKKPIAKPKVKENPPPLVKQEKLSKPITSNVSVVTVPFKDDDKKSQALKRQILPCVNITPRAVQMAEQPEALLNVVEPSPRKVKYEDDFEDEDEEEKINESGTGIMFPGYKKPIEIDDQEFKLPKPSPRGKDKQVHLIQPSSDEIAERLKSRDLLENKALDWIEQELMARFVNTLVNTEERPRIKDPIADITYDVDDDNDYDDEQPSETTMTMNENIVLDAIGEQGFQIFVDSGQPLDPDLIQALVREVLEEKIASMIGGGISMLLEQQPSDDLFKEPVKPPQPTPRNIERLSNGHLILNLNQIETPKPTPVHSPVTSPRLIRKPVTPELSPQNSVIEEPQFSREPPKVVIPQVVELDDVTESLIETATDEENEEVELIFDPKLIIIPKTPQETPRNSPSPPPTPTISQPIVPPPIVAPPPVVTQPVQPQKILVTSSVQCDPEPKLIPVTVPIPQVTVPIKRTVVSSSSSSSSVSLTSSSSLSKEALSTTSDDQSMLSEGCWIKSRSEGQVITNVKNAAEKNLMSLVQIEPTDSEGEMNLNIELNENKIKKKAKNKHFLNRMSSESGEVQVKSSTNGNGNGYGERSDGEVTNGNGNRQAKKSDGEITNGNGNYMHAKRSDGEITNDIGKNGFDKLNKFFSGNTKDDSSNGRNKEKTVINLHVSDKKVPPKNNIQIEAMPNLRDSRDFDRKIVSSTPDSSAVFTSSHKKWDLPNDIVDYRIPNESDDYLNRQSPTKRRITINMNYDSKDDDNQDTLSNFSDIEN